MNEETFTAAVQRLEARMYRTAVSLLWNDADAADAIQECILKAWDKRHTLRNEKALDGWLMRILINECRNIQRRRRRQPLPLEEALTKAAPDAPDLEVREAIRTLPEGYRLPLVLHYVERMDLEEVSTVLRLPVTTVKGRLFRARKMLQAKLREEVDVHA